MKLVVLAMLLMTVLGMGIAATAPEVKSTPDRTEQPESTDGVPANDDKADADAPEKQPTESVPLVTISDLIPESKEETKPEETAPEPPLKDIIKADVVEPAEDEIEHVETCVADAVAEVPEVTEAGKERVLAAADTIETPEVQPMSESGAEHASLLGVGIAIAFSAIFLN